MLSGALILASPLLLVFLAFKVKLGMPVGIAFLWAVLGIYGLWAADLLFFPLLLDASLRESAGDITGSLGLWVNLIPSATISAELGGIPSVALRQIGGNTGLLLPLGLIGPIVMPSLRRVRRLMLIALGVSLVIEVVQFAGTLTGFIERSVDIDDVVLNVAGALLGWLVWRAVLAALRGRRGLVGQADRRRDLSNKRIEQNATR